LPRFVFIFPFPGYNRIDKIRGKSREEKFGREGRIMQPFIGITSYFSEHEGQQQQTSRSLSFSEI
jgi:hypothetical protein